VLAGRVGRPHGLDGSFHVVEPVPSLLVEGARLADLGEIESRKGADSKPIVRLEGVTTREAADALRGRWLDVLDVTPEALEEDEYLADDLVGCTVVDGPDEVGIVARMLPLPSCEALELEDGTLVPLVRDCVKSVDIGAKRIEIDRGFLGAA
jgi:16S rRNA processing protein RimM